MINREDMLALTRRMTVKRTSMTRIAGGYLDMDGYIDGTFNTGFLKLSPDEKEKNLQIAKVIPFADTNQNLKEYAFSSEKMKGDSMWKLLMGMRVCGLKNDALMETFYEIVGEQYQAMGDYAVYVFHDRYDIPAKGKDHVRQGESEEMFEYLSQENRSAAFFSRHLWMAQQHSIMWTYIRRIRHIRIQSF